MPNLTDLSTIRDVCARHDFALSKGFGQNFIINPGICPRIAEASGIGPGWGALEVGPGIGCLTEQLAQRAGKVVSVELDERLRPVLTETLAGYQNVELVFGDVLALDLPSGVSADSGEVAEGAVQADATVTFDCTKPLHFAKASKPLCGALVCADIGIGKALGERET